MPPRVSLCLAVSPTGRVAEPVPEGHRFFIAGHAEESDW